MTTSKRFLYGKSNITNVVSIEREDGKVVIYREVNGSVSKEEYPASYWILYSRPGEKRSQLEGNLHYRFVETFRTKEEFYAAKRTDEDIFVAYNLKEMYMLRSGLTYYKGMEPKDVSILSFDIETTGLTHNDDAKVLIISNTLRKGGITTRKLFSIDNYSSNKEMIHAWCTWVRKVDPSILAGHNIYRFDIPYLKFCAGSLRLGRDGSNAKINKYTSQFKRDQYQSYDYNNVSVYGRELVDTQFLSYKYDVSRNFPSYGLKAIMRSLGLEKEDRQHYDAATIARKYTDAVEWEKIKKYAEHDADDALAIFDLMIPAFFYYNQSIPKPLQQIINSATGSQVNSFMLRSYIQERHSVPKASPPAEYEGGISYGNPGIYSNVYKVDVASLYPSIIRQYKIADMTKDPKGHFLRMVSAFTDERLKNKALAKQTGEQRYKDLEQAQKIMINSAYGFMGAPGLNFNAPEYAPEVTRKGREILKKGVAFAEKANYQIVNVDTDSFSFTTERGTGKRHKMSEAAFEAFIKLLNQQFDEMIKWENDGVYDKFIVVKAKNYVLKRGDKITIKGSGLKATMKEPAFRRFIEQTIQLILEGRYEWIKPNYLDHVGRISGLSVRSGIDDYCSKKTITKAVISPKRTNERRIREALRGRPCEEGDKIRVFFKTPTELALAEDFDGTYCATTLYKKLYMTIKIFKSILDIKEFPNFALKKNQTILKELIDEQERQIALPTDNAGHPEDRVDFRTKMERVLRGDAPFMVQSNS